MEERIKELEIAVLALESKIKQIQDVIKLLDKFDHDQQKINETVLNIINNVW